MKDGGAPVRMNLRPHPYQVSRAKRCADRRFPRSPLSVRAEGCVQTPQPEMPPGGGYDSSHSPIGLRRGKLAMATGSSSAKHPPADAPRLAQALASAFQDDAVIAWIFPDQQRRRRVPPAFKGTTIAPAHLSWCSGLHTFARGGVKRLVGRGCIVSGAEGLEEQTESLTIALADRSGSAVLDEPTGPLGGCFLAKSLGQLADLGFGVAPMAAQGLQEGQPAFLGPAGHGLG